MRDTEKSSDELLDLFGDDLARRILTMTSDAPMSATALAEELDVSRPTVYRRVNALAEHGLLGKQLETDADGHHYKTFELAVEEVAFEIADGELSVTVEADESLVDRFDGFLSGLEASYPRADADADERPDRTPSRGDGRHG